jgi:hypothetical protein
LEKELDKEKQVLKKNGEITTHLKVKNKYPTR